MKIPCGTNLGHGEWCIEGHLCSRCTDMQVLVPVLKLIEWQTARVVEDEDRVFLHTIADEALTKVGVGERLT